MKHRAVISKQMMDGYEAGSAPALPEEVAHRFARVLRLEPGTTVELLDGTGRLVKGALIATEMGWELERTVFESAAKLPAPIVLVQALIRPAKLEPLVQKATEMGLTELILWQAERSELKPSGDKFEKKIDRLRKISLEAARQSGRRDAPWIHGPLSQPALVALLKERSGHFMVGRPDARLWVTKHLQTLEVIPDEPLGLIVGPESGLSPTEEELFSELSLTGVRLSPNVLRTETAIFPFLSAAQWHRGQL